MGWVKFKVKALILSAFVLGLYGVVPALATTVKDGLATPASDIMFDPAVVRGQLANGLHYAILPNAKPEKAATIRLYIGAGSFDETDKQRGSANFISHMAFAGSTHFAPGQVTKRFEAEGIALNRTQSVHTSLNATRYDLDLTNLSPAKLDLAFTWLRDVADGLSLDPAAVNRERTLVVAQYDLNLGGPKDITDAMNGFISPNLRATGRNPLGTAKTIAAMDAKTLRKFYQAWYVPANAYLVVVGDAPADDIKARIEASFGSWKPARVPSRAAPGTVDASRGLEVQTKTVPNAPTALFVCKVSPPLPEREDTLASRTWLAERYAWKTVLDERLGRLARSVNSPFLTVGVDANAGDDVTKACVQALATNGKWTLALAAVQTELMRLDKYGVQSGEWASMRAAQDAAVAKAVSTAETRNSHDLADDLTFAISRRSIFTTPAENKRVTDLVSADINAEKLTQGFQDSWTGSGPLVSIISPTPIDALAVKAAWDDVQANTVVSAPEAAGSKAWPYNSFGPSGSVVSRKVITAPGFVRLVFANGVKVNLKTSTLEKGYVWIRIRFGSGHRQIDPALKPAVLLSETLFVPSGLGKLSLDELRVANANNQWGLSLTVSRDAFLLRGDANIKNLGREMETLTAFLSDPGFRREAEVRVTPAVDSLFDAINSVPATKVAVAMSDYAAGDTLQSMSTKAALSAVEMRDVQSVLKGPMQNDGLEVTLVGDISEADAVALIARTLGSLPPRPDALTIRDDFKPLVYPAGKTIRVEHEGPADQSAIMMAWPTFVLDEAHRKQIRAIGLAAEIFKIHLRDRMRKGANPEFEAAVYAQFPNRFDQGSIGLFVQVKPQYVDATLQDIKAITKAMSEGMITAAELKTVRDPILAYSAKLVRNNGWWMGVMDSSARDPGIIDANLSMDRETRAVSLADIKAVAAQWLKPELAIAVIANPKPEKVEAAAASPAKPTP